MKRLRRHVVEYVRHRFPAVRLFEKRQRLGSCVLEALRADEFPIVSFPDYAGFKEFLEAHHRTV